MSSAVVRPVNVQELREQAAHLFVEHAAEVAEAADSPAPDWATYEALEGSGLLCALLLTVDDEPEGYSVATVTRHPNEDDVIAASTAVYVTERGRKAGAGLAMLRAAESHAADAGASRFVWSCAPGSRMDAVLRGRGFQVVEHRYMRRL